MKTLSNAARLKGTIRLSVEDLRQTAATLRVMALNLEQVSNEHLPEPGVELQATESLPELEHLLRLLRSRLRSMNEQNGPQHEFYELNQQDIAQITALLARLAMSDSATFTRPRRPKDEG